MNNTRNSNFSRIGKDVLYRTTSSQYGSPWVLDNFRPEQVDIKYATVPTFSQIYDSMDDFRRSQKLIKSKIFHQELQSEGIDLNVENQKYMKKTEFPIKNPDSYKYPEPGLNIGSIIYRTNNMNYGSTKPNEFELPTKYFPCNHTFTKSFSGGNYKFEGLNTDNPLQYS